MNAMDTFMFQVETTEDIPFIVDKSDFHMASIKLFLGVCRPPTVQRHWPISSHHRILRFEKDRLVTSIDYADQGGYWSTS